MSFELEPVFVFGSNKSGRHGKGAALQAVRRHGAKYGQGEGFQGNSYAIPTKDARLKALPLTEIQQHVETFLTYARVMSHKQFYVTAVGTGLAGYTHAQIAPMFRFAPGNCLLPRAWRAFIDGPDSKFMT